MSPRRPIPIRITSVPGTAARAAQSVCSEGLPGSSCPVTTVNEVASPRWVTGIPAAAGAAIALVTPGTTSKGTPAAASASASSPAAAEDERVAALQAHDPPAATAVRDERRVDLVLGHGGAPGGLARVEQLGAGPAEGQQPLGAEAVVDDDVGALQRVAARRGDQARVAGPGADQVDHPAHRRTWATTAAATRPRSSGSSAGPSRSVRPPGPPVTPPAKAVILRRPPPASSQQGPHRPHAASPELGQERPLGAQARVGRRVVQRLGGRGRERRRRASASTARSPCPGAGVRDVHRRGAWSRPATARAAAGRRRPAPARRPPRARACRAGCRRCPGSARSTGRAGSRGAGPPAGGCPSRPGRPTGRASRPPAGPISTSRGSSRGGTATIASPSGISPGRSLAEWTARSARPSRSASSSSFTNMPAVGRGRPVRPRSSGRPSS